MMMAALEFELQPLPCQHLSNC